jgi:ribosomal protein S27AE
MNQTCDRCGPAIGAAYRVDRVSELYLCGHCASRHWRALSAEGWTFWSLGVHAIAPQANIGPGYGPAGDAVLPGRADWAGEGASDGDIRRGGRPGQ